MIWSKDLPLNLSSPESVCNLAIASTQAGSFFATFLIRKICVSWLSAALVKPFASCAKYWVGWRVDGLGLVEYLSSAVSTALSIIWSWEIYLFTLIALLAYTPLTILGLQGDMTAGKFFGYPLLFFQHEVLLPEDLLLKKFFY